MNIDLGRARMIRNIDYFMGTFWFCLGAYLALDSKYPALACFFMCMGPFLAYNAWREYSFKSLIKDAWGLINDLEAHNKRLMDNKHLMKFIDAQEQHVHDDYEGGYVE